MRTTAALVLAVAMMGVVPLCAADVTTSAEQTPKAVKWAPSFEAALGTAAKSGKPLMVDFYTDWCSYCDRMHQEVLTQRSIIKLSLQFECVKVDCEAQKAIADRYGADTYPTYLFLDPQGAVLLRSDGYVPAEAFAVRMRTALAVYKALPERKELQARYDAGEATPEEVARLGYLLRQAGRDAAAYVVLDHALAQLSAESPAYAGARADRLILGARDEEAGSVDALSRWVEANPSHAKRWEAQYEMGLAQANANSLYAAVRTLQEVARADAASDVGIMAGFYAKIIDGIVNVPVGSG